MIFNDEMKYLQCEECFQLVLRTGLNQKYCTECRKKLDKERITKYNREYRRKRYTEDWVFKEQVKHNKRKYRERVKNAV